jgi:regulator of protease activity HflC (stomatin/prohibitin superfamily)
MNSNLKLIGAAVVLLISAVVCLLLFEIKNIKGNEMGIKETWSDGVVNQTFPPKTYFLFPGYSQEIITYDMSAQITTLNDYRVQSQEGQDLKIDAKLQWRRDPSKLVQQHKTVREGIDQKIIVPGMMRVIKDLATSKKAVEQYSGDGLVSLQNAIQTRLSEKTSELAEKGVIVENFVIVHIELDPKYIEEIKGRQIATQRQLRAVEEQKAADAEALVAKAKAQADLNKQVVEAERDKQVTVLKAEAANEQTILEAKAQNEKAILAAKAEKEKRVLEGEGEKLSQIAKAEGILAMGKSEAEAQKLKLQAYAVQGADAYVKVEVARQVGTAFQNIKGYLPADMKVNLLTESFEKSIDTLTGSVVVPTRR